MRLLRMLSIAGTMFAFSAILPIAHAANISTESSAVNGTVWAWGNNSYGQLGVIATSAPIPAPERVGKLTRVTSVSAGYDFALALTAAGHVWSWGNTYQGRLGNSAAIDSYAAQPTPRLIATLPAIRQIAAGYDHSLVVDSHGDVWGWGNDSESELGPTTNPCSCVPRPVQMHGLPKIRAVAVGGGYESDFSVALAVNGTVWAWGSNESGQLGVSPSTTFESGSPEQVHGLSGIVAISAGARHVLALDRKGVLWAWGADENGQLGDGTYCGPYACLRFQPQRVAGSSAIRSMAAGETNSAIITKTGQVWTWGDNYSGQLGDGQTCDSVTDQHCASSRPVLVKDLAHATSVAIGSDVVGDFMVSLRNDHSVWCWGDNGSDELGQPSPPVTSSNHPVTPSTNQDESLQVSAGGNFTVVLRQTGT